MPPSEKPTSTKHAVLLLGICRIGIITEVTKSQRTRVAHGGGKLNPAYRAAQYDEVQEAHLAKGRFQKTACIVVDLALKARPKQD